VKHVRASILGTLEKGAALLPAARIQPGKTLDLRWYLDAGAAGSDSS